MSVDTITDISVQVGFGVDAVGGAYFVLNDATKGKLNDTTYLLAPDDVFVTIPGGASAIQTTRGRDRETDEYRAGRASITFNDTDRTLDPAYSGSPYAGQIAPMKLVRVLWQDVILFTGWAEDWSVFYERGDTVSRVTAACSDGFIILANQRLSEIVAAHSGDTTGQRIERILDRPEVNFPASRAIDTGNTILGDTTLGGNALAFIQECAKAEAGYLFVAVDGTLTFRNRLATLNVPSDVSFTDDADTGNVPYRDITQRSAVDLLFSRVTATSDTTGNESVATDTDSSDSFFIRTLALGNLPTLDDAQTQSIVDYYLERFKTPELRFDTATINMLALSDEQIRAVLNLELTDVVTVERSPLGVGSTIERMSLVEGIAHRISHGSWTVQVSFSNADTRAFLMLDDATFGKLGTNRLAF